jgi:acetate kinase
MAVGESGSGSGRAKVILSINAGSSSVKISVYNISSSGIPHELAVTQLDGLTAPPAKLKYVRGLETVCRSKVVEEEIKDQDAACKYLVDELVDDEELKEITKREDVTHICHRIVHGGSFSKPQIVTNETYHVLEALTELAPLHNSPALAIIRSCIKVLPHVRNIAYFDSQFHQSIPEHIRTYPINLEIAKKNELRKYGFHGISYAFITRSAAEFLGKGEDETNIIALHLGSGASACAIKNGKSWDTSMGLTPLAGLPGATRSGSVDPRYFPYFPYFLHAYSYPVTAIIFISSRYQTIPSTTT